MRIHNLPVTAVFAALVPSLVWAQHEGHQPASTQAPSAQLTECLRVQPVIDNIITAATSRAEAARLSNSPTDLRAAVETLEAALRDIRAQSASCSAAATATVPHAEHTMPVAQPSASRPAAKAPARGADPHAGHSMPSADRPSKGTGTHEGHSAAPSGDKQMDPVNGLIVDPAKAPKTTYQGHTYYFSSEQSRNEFLQDPAKFAKKSKE